MTLAVAEALNPSKTKTKPRQRSKLDQTIGVLGTIQSGLFAVSLLRERVWKSMFFIEFLRPLEWIWTCLCLFYIQVYCIGPFCQSPRVGHQECLPPLRGNGLDWPINGRRRGSLEGESHFVCPPADRHITAQFKIQQVIKCVKSTHLMWKKLILPARWW